MSKGPREFVVKDCLVIKIMMTMNLIGFRYRYFSMLKQCTSSTLLNESVV